MLTCYRGKVSCTCDKGGCHGGKRGCNGGKCGCNGGKDGCDGGEKILLRCPLSVLDEIVVSCRKMGLQLYLRLK